MVSTFTNAIYQLQPDLFSIIVPFLLIFVIVFAVMQKTKILGDPKKEGKRYNALVALVMGLIVVGQHIFFSGSKYDIVPALMSSLPQVALILVAVVMALTLLGLLGGSTKIEAKGFAGYVFAAAVLIILFIFGSNYGLGFYNISNWFDRSTVNLVVAIIIFVLVIRFIIGGDEEKKKDKDDTVAKKMLDMFTPSNKE